MAGTAGLTFYEDSKSNIISNAGFRPLDVTISMEMTLNLVGLDNSTITADAAVAEFKENYCACVNLQDAAKFTNTNETFSLLRNGISLAIERRPIISKNDTLFLRLIQSTQRNYQLVFKPNNLDQPNLQAFLEDSYTATATPISLVDGTTFNFNINGDAASISRDRFRLVFKEAVILPVTFRDVEARQQGKDIAVTWKVENQLNILQYEVEKSNDGRTFTKVNTQAITDANNTSAIYHWLDINAIAGDNFYRIRYVGQDGTSGYSKVVKVNIAKGPGEIVVYPNPVTGRILDLQLNNMAQGKYIIRLLSTIGQLLQAKEINHTGGSSTEKIILSKDIANGIYNLEITHPDRSKTMINLIMQ